MRMWWGLAVGAMCVSLACGGGDDSAAPSTTGQVSPTAPLPEDPAERFVALTEPFNCLLGEAVQLENSGAGDDELREMADRVAAEQAVLFDDLADFEWPTDVQPAVDSLVAADNLSSASIAAATVRDMLGLPEQVAFCPGEGG